MKDNEMHDMELRALLRENTPEPPYDAVDWSALHAGITARARPLLQRAPAPWWQLIAGWSTYGIPATAGAAALLLVLLGTAVMRPVAEHTAPAVAYATLADELSASEATVLDATAEDILEDMLLQSASW
jgi:hypothetical protein